VAVDVESRVVIRRPLEVVASFAADPDRITQWYRRIRSVQWLTPKPLRVGSELAFTAQFLGRRLVYTYRVIAYDPGRTLIMRTADGPFPMETTYTWEAVDDDTTLMRLRNRGEPVGFSRFMAPFLGAAVRRANRQDLRKLAQILRVG
jgi:uncharacterized membrane protein